MNKDDDESATDVDEVSENESLSDSEHASPSTDDSVGDDDSDGSDLGVGLRADEILARPLMPDIDNEHITLCLVCPGKQLKNASMMDVHSSSAVCLLSLHIEHLIGHLLFILTPLFIASGLSDRATYGVSNASNDAQRN